MAALKDIARDNADELREGIAWVIVWRTGRSWHALPIWSDLEAGEWEAGDLNDAISVLKVDPDAVALNGYYCGHFGEDMNIEQLAAGIRWHHENGYNRLANRYDIEEAQTSIEEARKAAEAVGLPFSEKLADGAGDEPDPYIYDGSMSPGDYEAAQRARDAHTALAEVVTSRFPAAGPDAIDRITDAASGLKLSPETMQRILDAFDTILLPPVHAKRARQQRKPKRIDPATHPERHRPQQGAAPRSQARRDMAEQLPAKNVRFSVLRAPIPGTSGGPPDGLKIFFRLF